MLMNGRRLGPRGPKHFKLGPLLIPAIFDGLGLNVGIFTATGLLDRRDTLGLGGYLLPHLGDRIWCGRRRCGIDDFRSRGSCGRGLYLYRLGWF